jgi:hypothetical protein
MPRFSQLPFNENWGRIAVPFLLHLTLANDKQLDTSILNDKEILRRLRLIATDQNNQPFSDMSNEILDYVEGRKQREKPTKAKDPVSFYTVFSSPWSRLGCDAVATLVTGCYCYLRWKRKLPPVC